MSNQIQFHVAISPVCRLRLIVRVEAPTSRRFNAKAKPQAAKLTHVPLVEVSVIIKHLTHTTKKYHCLHGKFTEANDA
jgi:hypothetical protein